MPGSAITAGHGVVLIEIPDDGALGDVLTKLSSDPFDFAWLPGGGGGGTIIIEDEGIVVGVPADTLDFVGAGVTASGAGTTKTITIPGGATDLQAAYDADTTVPQILINGTPDPLTIDASVVGDIFTLRGTVGTILMHMATDGSEIWGGHNSGDILALAGANAGADVGRVNINAPTEFFYAEGNTTPAEQSAVRWRPTFTTAGAYIGGFFANNANITYTNPFYIYSSIQDNSVHISNAAAGFQAWTLFNALSIIRRGTSNALVQAITLNDGVVHQNLTANPAVTTQHISVSSSPNVLQGVAGGSMTVTNGQFGIQFAPKYSCVAGGAIDVSDCIGLSYVELTVALFGTNAGTRTVDNMIGLDMPNMQGAPGYTRTGEIAAVRSAQNSATDAFFLRHTGTAISSLLGQVRFDSDLTGLTFGASQDYQVGWAAGNFFFNQFNATASQLRWSNPAGNRFEVTDENAGQDGEINFVFDKGAWGEGGAAGNNKYRFVAQAETVTIGGGYGQFILTQAANDTIDAALSQYFGWTLNGPNPTIGTGSIVDAGAMILAGNPAAGTNRYGLLILANPSGGTLNYALRCLNGDARFDARVDIDNPIALGGGALATLGTIGATGPTAAAQAQWLEIDIGGVAHWIPVWT